MIKLVRRQTNLLYVLLASLLIGRAQVFARSIADRNGFELWRPLSQESEPARTSRALVQLIEVMNFRLSWVVKRRSLSAL